MTIASWTAASIGLLLWGMPALASAPAVYTVYKNTEVPLAQCVSRAQAVMAQNGFTNVKSATYSTFGYSGDYTIVLRCMPAEKTVMSFVAGPELAECDRLANKALNEF